MEKFIYANNLKIKCSDGIYNDGLLYVPFRDVQECIDNAPAADVVSREEYNSLLKRFKHLIQSEFISSFDEKDRFTHDYKRDIKEADQIAAVFQKKGKLNHAIIWYMDFDVNGKRRQAEFDFKHFVRGDQYIEFTLPTGDTYIFFYHNIYAMYLAPKENKND